VLKIAAVLSILIGIIHSYLGERYILIRLFRRNSIPHLFGSEFFTKGTLRFAWHMTTVAWFGFGYLLFIISEPNENITQIALHTIGAVFLVTGLLSFGFTRGKHLSWIVFWAISSISFYTAING
jgi:hypothetical protein